MVRSVNGQRRGLRPDRTIEREGALDRVPVVFVPVVEAAREGVTRTFGARMHSAYLYGSIPRGTARPGVSDLDMLVALHVEPADADRIAATNLEAALNSSFPQISGVGIGLASAPSLLSELERYDGGFFVACLCTPRTGPPDGAWSARASRWSCRAGAAGPAT